MKKLFKICENLTINPNFIYAIGKENNQSKIDDWNKTYKAYLEELIKNPVELDIDGTLYTLSDIGNDKELLKRYSEELKNYIIDITGECPQFYETYYTVLSSGNKVNLTKEVYDILSKYLEENFEIVENFKIVEIKNG